MRNLIGSGDKELFETMIESLNNYLKASGRLSDDAFRLLSQYNGLLWKEIEEQRDTLRDILYKGNNYEEHKKHDEPKENAPVKLFDKTVAFLKCHNYDELHWVRVYSVKFYMYDYKDFCIKYFEHKDEERQNKNYILFGNATKSYSIRKENNEILGDTTQCFEFILNLREKLGIDDDSFIND